MKIFIYAILVAVVFCSCQKVQNKELPYPWKPYAKEALEASILRKKPVVIDFFAQWCPNCHELDETVFSRHDIIDKLAQVTALRMDVTDQNDPAVQQMLQKYDIEGVPTIVFLDSRGKEIGSARIEGLVTPQEFFRALAIMKTLA